MSPTADRQIRQQFNHFLSKSSRPAGAIGLESELVRALEDRDLMDAAPALADNGYKSIKRLTKMTDEDVEALQLPRGTARELREFIASLRDAAGGSEPEKGQVASSGGVPALDAGARNSGEMSPLPPRRGYEGTLQYEYPVQVRGSRGKVARVSTDHCEAFTLAHSDALVSVDFYTADRKRNMKVQVENVLDDKILGEAREFADLAGPVFHVAFDAGHGNNVPDGEPVDLIVELSGTHCGHILKPDSLIFIMKSEAPADNSWRGVEGGKFEMLPQGDRVRGKITTGSFSWWSIACCNVKVVAHHIQVPGHQ